MGTRSGLLAGGNWIVDKLKVIDVYPQQDALANILHEGVANGGCPFNVLTDLARLGAPFPLAGIGLVGPDGEGKWIRDLCVAEGIDVTKIEVLPTGHTSYTDVMIVESTGRRTFFHQRGANAFLNVEHFDFSLTAAKLFHLGYLLLLDKLDQPDEEFGTVAARVLARARAAGCKTSVDIVSEDTYRFPDIVRPALRQVDYCILNEFELERTTGVVTRNQGEIDMAAVGKAARELIEAGVREWVIVHFPEGACAMGLDGKLVAQGSVKLPQSEIRSTVGAGDAFAAGLLYGFHEDCPIGTALRYGIGTAAACLCGGGASDGIRRLEECLKLVEEFGTREL